MTWSTAFITRHDVLDEAKPAVTHVGKGGIQALPLRVVLLAEELLLELAALGRLHGGGGAARGDWAAADVSVLFVVKPNPCVQLGVEVGLASKGQHPVAELRPLGVEAVGIVARR